MYTHIFAQICLLIGTVSHVSNVVHVSLIHLLIYLFIYTLIENTSSVVEGWRQNLKIFYKSKGTEKVVDEIKENQVVLIIGNSGTGKTTAMHHASLQLSEDGFEIIPVSSPTAIPSQRESLQKQLFVIDDVVGPYRVNKMETDLWDRLRDRILVAFKEKNAKLLMTSRRQVHEDITQILSTMFDLKIVDLDSNELALSKHERKGMLQAYLENVSMHIDAMQMTKMCSTKIAFPLLCRMFTANENFLREKANFFRSPSVLFKQELDSLQKYNERMYCVLVLLLFFDVKELQCIFDIQRKIERRDVYELVLSACDVPEGISRNSLKKRLLLMTGSYVEFTNPFQFIHDSLEATLAFHFGSQFQDIFVKCCKLRFIRDKVRLNKPSTKDKNMLVSGNSIVVKSEHYDVLLGRILTEISNGKFYDVLLCQALRDEKFVNRFVSYAQQNLKSLKKLEKIKCTENISVNFESRNVTLLQRGGLIELVQEERKSFIHWVAAVGSFPLFKALLERPKNVIDRALENFNLITEMLHLAVAGGSFENIDLLIKKGGNVMSYDKYGIPLVCKVARTRRCDIADLLINHGANVNQCDRVMGWTACFNAICINDTDMLKVLIKNGANLSHMDYAGWTPLIFAAISKKSQVVSLLLEEDPNSIDTLISSTCDEKDFPERIIELLDREQSKKFTMHLLKNNQKAAIQWLPNLLIQNNTMVKEMMNPFLDSKIKNKKSLSNDYCALLNAVMSKDTHILFNILENKDSTSATSLILQKSYCNPFHFGLLHIAVMCDNVATAKILIQYGADPLQKDVSGRTSLHLANSSAMLDVLINAKCEDNRTKLSFRNRVYKGFKFCICLQFNTIFLNPLLLSRTELNVNVLDDYGNTPLHLIVRNGSQKSDREQCLDAVETLIDNGATPDIRNSDGYLPIDYYRTFNSKSNSDKTDRGELLLYGAKVRQHIKREKIFLIILMCVVISLWVWLNMTLVKQLYFQENSSKYLTAIPPIRVNLYVSHTQIITIFVMHMVFITRHHYFERRYFLMFFKRFENAPIISTINSEKLFCEFLCIITVAFVVVRGLCNSSDYSLYTDILFNVFCAFLCFVYIVLVVSFTFAYKTYCRLLHYSFIAKFFFILYLCTWMLYLICYGNIDLSFTSQLSVFTQFRDVSEWLIACSFFVFIRTLLCITHLSCLLYFLRPLLHILYQPVFWRTREIRNICIMCAHLCLIAENMIVPLALVYHSVGRSLKNVI